MATLLAFWTPGAMEIVVLLVVGLILFGGNLPEVGKSVGKSLIEFRRGLKDLKTTAGLDEISKVKNEMMNMARDVDPRRMMDIDEQHLPDDPYKDAYQEGEFSEIESSKPSHDPESDPESESHEEDPGAIGPDPVSPDESEASERDDSGDSASEEDDQIGRLEGSHQEPHEEGEPPTFGYDRHG